MVLFLILNVLSHSRDILFADGEGTVGTLPFEEFAGGDYVRDQVGGGALDLFRQVGDAHGGMQ
jgi:hypothetical protein